MYPKQMETVLELNGKTVNGLIEIEIEADEGFSIDEMDFENEDQKNTLQRRIDRGNVEVVCILVKVSALGETETVSLGSCFVEKPDDVDNTVQEYALIAEATELLTTALKDKYDTLKEVFG